MKKLVLFFTFLFIFIPAKVFADCDNFSRYSLDNGNLTVSYINSDDTTGSVTVNQSNTALLPNYTKSLVYVSKNIVTTFKDDYLILQGSLEFTSFDGAISTGHNRNFPTVQDISSPVIAPTSDLSKESYCDIISISNNTPNSYTWDTSGNSGILYRISSFAFTLKCYHNPEYSTSKVAYRLFFYLGYNLLYGTDISLDSTYYISSNFRTTSLGVSSTCGNEQIMNSISAISSDITDINDTISDSDTSGAVSSMEDIIDDYSTDNHGLQAFVTAPLSFIQSLAQQEECVPITMPALLGNTSTFVLPCIMEEFEDRFPSLFAIYQIAIYFFVCYRIGIDLFRTVHKLKDPLNDEISVADI